MNYALWALGYFISLSIVKAMHKRGKAKQEEVNYFVFAGILTWPLYLLLTGVDHGSEYLSRLIAGSSKVRVALDSENEQLKAENKFLSEELVEAQQKLSALDGYRNHR